MSETVTVSQLAAELGVSVHRIYRRIYRGDLAAGFVHSRYGHFEISREEVERFKADGGVDSINPPRRFDGLMSVSEVARRTGLTPERVRRLCTEGILSHQREGARGRYRIWKESVEDLLNERTTDPYQRAVRKA
jgi:excisionase family DNA binding protein